MLRSARLGIVAALGLALAACGGGAASGPPAGGVPASKASAGSSAKPASSPAVAKPAAATSAQVVGQKAPGAYSVNGTAAVSGGQASIDATDSLKWQPNTLTVKGGDKVSLQVKNSGNTGHTFLSPGLSVNQTDVPVQKTITLSFTAPSAPGAYQFWCNIPGHAEAGMVGEVIVQ